MNLVPTEGPLPQALTACDAKTRALTSLRTVSSGSKHSVTAPLGAGLRSGTDWTPRPDLSSPSHNTWSPVPAGDQPSGCSQRPLRWSSVKTGWIHVRSATDHVGLDHLWRLIEGGPVCDAPKKGGQPVSAASLTSLSAADTSIVDPQTPADIIDRESRMQVPHPLDREIDEMDDTHRAMVRLFAADGHICEDERTILERFLDHYRDIAGYRIREVAADAFKRNGATDRTGRHFADAGFKLVDLEAERKARPGANVVTFPNRQSAG